MDLYQVCTNYAPWAKNGPATGVTLAYIKSNFSEYGHVAYQIIGNEAYNNMINILPLHTPLTPGEGSIGHFFSFLKVVMLHVKFTGMKQRTQCKPIFCPFIHLRPPDRLKKVKTILFLKVMLH